MALHNKAIRGHGQWSMRNLQEPMMTVLTQGMRALIPPLVH